MLGIYYCVLFVEIFLFFLNFLIYVILLMVVMFFFILFLMKIMLCCGGNWIFVNLMFEEFEMVNWFWMDRIGMVWVLLFLMVMVFCEIDEVIMFLRVEI